MTAPAFDADPWEADGLEIKIRGRGVVARIPTPQVGGTFACAANARLIANAPRLYHALFNYLHAVHPASQAACAAEARAVLAEVRGGE